jgi:hypothetical protein
MTNDDANFEKHEDSDFDSFTHGKTLCDEIWVTKFKDVTKENQEIVENITKIEKKFIPIVATCLGLTLLSNTFSYLHRDSNLVEENNELSRELTSLNESYSQEILLLNKPKITQFALENRMQILKEDLNKSISKNSVLEEQLAQKGYRDAFSQMERCHFAYENFTFKGIDRILNSCSPADLDFVISDFDNGNGVNLKTFKPSSVGNYQLEDLVLVNPIHTEFFPDKDAVTNYNLNSYNSTEICVNGEKFLIKGYDIDVDPKFTDLSKCDTKHTYTNFESDVTTFTVDKTCENLISPDGVRTSLEIFLTNYIDIQLENKPSVQLEEYKKNTISFLDGVKQESSCIKSLLLTKYQ